MYNFIVNERSGKYRGQKAIQEITDYCDENKIEYQVFITNAVGHAAKLTEEVCKAGKDNVIAVGGDGTFHEVLNGITDFEKITVGFIPAGRGNDFARAAKLSLDPVTAFKDILRGETKLIDFIQVGDLRSLNACGTGMDVDVLAAVINKKNAMTYYTSLVKCLLSFKPYHLKIHANGEVYEKEAIMFGVFNGTDFGGGMHVGVNAKIDDGVLDCFYAEQKKRNLLKILPHFVSGKHDDLPEIKHFNATEVYVETGGKPIELDGEIYPDRDLDCKIVPGKLRTYKVEADL